MKEEYNKVILILHSQGGIEGSLILDWLLTERQFTSTHSWLSDAVLT